MILGCKLSLCNGYRQQNNCGLFKYLVEIDPQAQHYNINNNIYEPNRTALNINMKKYL